MMGVINRAALA